MSEGTPTLEQIDRNPKMAANNNGQKLDLKQIGEASKVIQETHEDLVKLYEKHGMPADEARTKAEVPINTLTSDVMGKKVNEALANGTDEYAIMASIHKGAEEGREKSKQGTIKRIFHELIRKITPQ